MAETIISIIEDNIYMTQAWESFFNAEKDFHVSACYETCEDAFKAPEFKRSELVLMDIDLPGMSGIEGVAYIKQKFPDMLVLMVTVFDDDQHVFDALRFGAIGYLLKKVGPDDLCSAIRDAMAGGSPMTPEIARKVINSMQKSSEDLDDADLTERQKTVLKELATGKSYKTIGEELHLSTDGVRYHIRNIYEKLQVNNRSEAVSIAHKYHLL